MAKDSVLILQNQKRFRTSIPVYILAYEEFGKAVFLLGAAAEGRAIEESEFKRLTTAGSHSNKILIDYGEVDKLLNKMTDDRFRASQELARSTGTN